MCNAAATEWKETKTGGLRRLRLSEINLASSLYGFSIRYHQVWVHRGSYLPFNLQDNYTAMTPDGEMWFQEGVYQHDFSAASINMRHLFLHEMMHVWQRQRGMWIKTRGAFSWAADYSYSLDKARLTDYSMEQQACIVSDYWLLTHYGFRHTKANLKFRDYHPSLPEKELIPLYKKILKGFPS
ncbi:type IV secretion protein Rhs [Enterobacteriaceae bacterium RIT714]|nr:type IV secretion protein Rhs [Enterobacteriaceae bacterium RIT714]